MRIMPAEKEGTVEEQDQVNGQEDKKNVCSICQKNPAKYKCPKCFMKTCSLPCVKQHKEKYDCDGVRCKTGYISMSSYNESHMLSDYRLLEEIARCCDNHDREIKNSYPIVTKWMNIQMREARNMGINLKLLPYTFTQHKLNSTHFNNKIKSFSWHVTWHFPSQNLSVQRKKIPDSTIVLDALLECCGSEDRLQEFGDEKNISVFMKRCDLPVNQEKYHKLDASDTIKQSLKGKTIIEFPQFIVTTKERAKTYEDKVSEEVIPFGNDEVRTGSNGRNRNFDRRTKFHRKKRPFPQRTGDSSASPQKKTLNIQDQPQTPPNPLFNHGAVESFP